MATKRILNVVTNVDSYQETDAETGLWLSELTHAYDIFEAAGYEQTLVSPNGGKSPLEPRSLKFPSFDSSAKKWFNNPERMQLLETTAAPAEINAKDYDAIFFTGGHAVMYDFPGSEGLQQLTREIYENGGIVAAVCHGYCGLLETTLSNGEHLVKGKNLTGFSWNEEVLAGVAKKVPYNVQERMENLGANYSKGLIPFSSYTVVDGRLVTGQNPGSAKETAEKTVEVLQGL